jgi:cytosine/adenosine deaminase-related metal-dependent hydrolase
VRTRYDAPWIIAFDDSTPGERGHHALLSNGSVVVEDDRIVWVGREYSGQVDEVVTTDSVISPGFISTHTHMQESPADKSLAEDIAKRQFWSTSLVDVLPPRGAALTIDDMQACADFSVVEHLRGGCTTVVHMGEQGGYIADVAERTGLRAYIADSYRSARWFTRDGRRVEYAWDEDAGWAGLGRAVDLVTALEGRADGRIRGFLNPAQIDTCSAELLRSSAAEAERLDVPVSVHAAQSVSEFLEITRRHGRTPVEWLNDLGFLSPRAILGHVIFTTGSPWVNFHGDDLGLLAESGATVSYNAWVFARNGIVLESYRKYLEAGVNVTLGTDTVSQSMIESCRWTAILGKVVERRSDGATAAEVFDSATVRAADALGRDDLGRIAAGAKADLVFWRTDTLSMTPLRDPIRNIVYYAQSSDIETVLVDGRAVMTDGRVPSIDLDDVLPRVQAAGERVWSSWQDHDWAGRTIEEHMPSSYPAFRG